jgi:hypothetical protein
MSVPELQPIRLTISPFRVVDPQPSRSARWLRAASHRASCQGRGHWLSRLEPRGRTRTVTAALLANGVAAEDCISSSVIAVRQDSNGVSSAARSLRPTGADSTSSPGDRRFRFVVSGLPLLCFSPDSATAPPTGTSALEPRGSHQFTLGALPHRSRRAGSASSRERFARDRRAESAARLRLPLHATPASSPVALARA